LDLGRTFPKNILLEVEETVPLEKSIRCSSLEKIENTVPLKEDVGCSSLEEKVSTAGAAASVNTL
jgi:hypothetical protein